MIRGAGGLASLGKAPTDSVTPTTKLAHAFPLPTWKGVGSGSGKRLTKRGALWLRAIKDKTDMAKIRALDGNEEDLPKVGSVAFEI